MNTRFSLNSLNLKDSPLRLDKAPTVPPKISLQKSLQDSSRPQGQPEERIDHSPSPLASCPEKADSIFKATKSRPVSLINSRTFNYNTKSDMDTSALTVAPSTSSVASAGTTTGNQSESGSGFEFGYDGYDVRRTGRTVNRGGGGGGPTGATLTTSAVGESSLSDAAKGQSIRPGAYHRKRERLRFVSRSCPGTPVKHRYVSPLIAGTEARKDVASVACGSHVRDTDRPARGPRESSSHRVDHFRGAIRFFSSSELPQVHCLADKDFNRNSNVGQNFMQKSLIEIETAL